jgi:hypothetical protein
MTTLVFLEGKGTQECVHGEHDGRGFIEAI